jgi:hypothetical protein
MWRNGRIGLLNPPRRRKSKGRAATDCSECGQTEPSGTDSPASNESKKFRAVSPPRNCKQERTEATGDEKRALSASGPKGRKRVCIICSKPSDEIICRSCADKVSADALEKKKWEEKGKA